MSEKRIDWIDSLKGIGIILVVLGHLSLPLWLETYIYSFHMPLFFFISGYLLDLNKPITAKDYIKKKSIGLLIPYAFFALISLPVGILRAKFLGTSINLSSELFYLFYLKGSVGWNSPLWFLVCLFIVEVTVFLLLKKNRKLSYIIIAISSCLGYLCTFLPFRLPFGLDVVAVVIPFFVLGHIIKEQKIIEKLNSGRLIRFISAILFLGFNILLGNILNVRISVYHFIFGNYIYFYISAIAGIMFVVSAVYNIKKSRLLEYYGKNTLLILATHYIAFSIYEVVGKVILHNNFMNVESLTIPLLVTVTTLIFYIPIIWFVNQYIPFAVGKKKIQSSPKK